MDHDTTTMTEENAVSDPVRRRLIAMVAERKVSLATASRAIGRNHSYLQQFVKRGTPRRLPEETRYALAVFLNVEERALRPLNDRDNSAGSDAISADRPELRSFVARLAVARAESPFPTPSAFAEAAGIDRWRYGEFEEGEEEPSLDELDSIARTSGKRLDWLIRGGAATGHSGMLVGDLDRQSPAKRPAVPRPTKTIDNR